MMGLIVMTSNVVQAFRPAREGGPEGPHYDYQLRRIINSMRRDVFVPASWVTS